MPSNEQFRLRNAETGKLSPTPIIALVVVLALVVVAVGVSLSGPSSKSSSTVTPLRTMPAAANTIGGTAQDTNGDVYALVNSGKAANVQKIDFSTGKVVAIFPVSVAATSIALGGNVLAVGTSFKATGSVAFYSLAGKKLRTVPMPAPVVQITSSSDQYDFFALTKYGQVAAALDVNQRTGTVTNNVPLSASTNSLVVDPGIQNLYTLVGGGTIQIVNLGTKAVTQHFVVSPYGSSITLSPNGGVLYELKNLVDSSNISVISTATEAVVKVVPAPADCVAAVPSFTGPQVIDYVGAQTFGNIQIFAVPS
jgi:hypothetical protein